MKRIFNLLILSSFVLLAMSSCQQAGGDSTGSEYMPDMVHSIAYEANYYAYYSHHAWDGKDSYYKYAKPRVPVNGTIPRGFSGDRSHNDGTSSSVGIKLPLNGAEPFYYANTEEGRADAIENLTENPYPITEKGLEEGKELYNIYCAICHGVKADGDGYLVRDDGGKYPVQPANLIDGAVANSSDGRFYHTIVYGRNLMGSHADKLSYKERWEVIHYIRSLQAKKENKVYSEVENTFNHDKIPSQVQHGIQIETDHETNDNGHGHDTNTHGSH